MRDEAPESDVSSRFNLVDDPWIPVLDTQGQELEVSIREALTHAEQYRDVTGELPSVRFSILRVLLAILYRSLDSEDEDSPLEFWQELWEDSELPQHLIGPYLEEWRHRFDLLSPSEPFMQVPGLHTAKGEWKPVDLIVADVQVDDPLFTMRSELTSLTFPEAARWLVHANAYDYSGIKSGPVGDSRVKGGKSYPMGVGWCGWLGGVTLTGSNLRETLLLNYIADRPTKSENDVPIWEQAVLPVGQREPEEIGDAGPIALMTWPQRRFRLQVADDRVTGVLVTNGDALDYTVQWDVELMSGWRFSVPQSQKAKSARYMPQTFTAGRSLWRGLNTLIPQGESARLDHKLREKWNVTEKARPAAVLTWLAELIKYGVLSPSYLVEVSAVSMEYGAQMSSYSEVVSDRLAFAAALAPIAEDNRLLELAQNAVQRTDRAVRALEYLAQDLDRAAGGDGTGPGDEVAERAYADFDQTFRRWLLEVQPGCDGEALLDSWTDEVRRSIRARGEVLMATAPPSAWVGHATDMTNRLLNVSTAMHKFERNLYYGLGGSEAAEQESTDDDE